VPCALNYFVCSPWGRSERECKDVVTAEARRAFEPTYEGNCTGYDTSRERERPLHPEKANANWFSLRTTEQSGKAAAGGCLYDPHRGLAEALAAGGLSSGQAPVLMCLRRGMSCTECALLSWLGPANRATHGQYLSHRLGLQSAPRLPDFVGSELRRREECHLAAC
jgi:hypothetical protein